MELLLLYIANYLLKQILLKSLQKYYKEIKKYVCQYCFWSTVYLLEC